MFEVPWLWLIAGLVLVGLEAFISGVFLLWIGLGAMLIGIVLMLFPEMGTTLQLVLFAASMLLAVGAGFVVQRRGRRTPELQSVNSELKDLLGLRTVTISDFHTGRGRVRVGDTSYSAVCDTALEKGQTVVIVAIKDGRLQVSPVETPDSTSRPLP